MADEDQLEALRKRHADLDRLLLEEQARPMPDASTITEIKRQKLAIKDRIAGVEAQPGH